MKEVLEPLQAAGLLFKRFEPFDLRRIGSRKRIAVYYGVDVQNRYALVFYVRRKSRVLKGEAESWLEIARRIETLFGHPLLQRIVLVEAPLCSKASRYLQLQGWRVLRA